MNEWSDSWNYTNDKGELKTFIRHKPCGKAMTLEMKETHKCNGKTTFEPKKADNERERVKNILKETIIDVLELTGKCRESDLSVEFSSEDIRTIINTVFIQRMRKEG